MSILIQVIKKIFKKKFQIHFDKFEVYKYNEIKQSLVNCSQMWANQKEFLNGIIRKFKPEKIVEL